MKYKLVIVLLLVILCFININVYSKENSFELEIVSLINQYKIALEEKDIETIKQISSSEFAIETEHYLNRISIIVFERLKLDSCNIFENTKTVKCKFKGYYLQRTDYKIGSKVLNYRGSFWFELENRNNNYILTNTDLYEKDKNDWLHFLSIIAIVISAATARYLLRVKYRK